MINFSDIDFFIYTFFYIKKRNKKQTPAGQSCQSLFSLLCVYVSGFVY